MKTNRIDECFARLDSSGRSAFVAYVCAGDPDMASSLKVLRSLESAGADIIELGVPFSDPMADGVVNQMAAHRALQSGATFPGVLDLVRDFRKSSEIPIVLFTYLNPIYAHGFERFHADAADAGVDGVLFLDLPPDETGKNEELQETDELKHIRLIAPTTPAARIPFIAEASEGFLYYVSREGVTGAQETLAEGIESNVAKIKEHSSVPVVVGFGISTPEQSAAVAQAADGVVVGSAIVRIIEKHSQEKDLAERVENFVRPLVEAAQNSS